MFATDEDFVRHVTVVFTFNDKSPIDDQAEWLAELCPEFPQLSFTSHGMDSVRDDIFEDIF